jgi:hypothetical protein
LRDVERVPAINVTRVIEGHAIGALKKQHGVAGKVVALYRDAHAAVEECFQSAEVLFDVVGLEALYGILGPGRYVFVDPLLDVAMIIPDKPRSADEIEDT